MGEVCLDALGKILAFVFGWRGDGDFAGNGYVAFGESNVYRTATATAENSFLNDCSVA